jgi:class 3 adenylate cyclase/tetratricopeptide (TPR) repeat protein
MDVPAPSREERKVVSVLFCDLVGFTSRSESMDVEDVRGTLQPYHALLRRELERHGGTVEKFIGDAVMAVFGAPVAHEDDPERAVRSALAIVDAVAELRERDPAMDLHVRIGVNTGEALIALGADPARGEGMASGDVVNTAARLESAAPADGVLVGEVTYRATSRVIRYEPAEPVTAKGKSEPVPAWRAVEARSRFGIDVVQESRTPLVGRDDDMATLAAALERAIDRRAVQLVTLVGVPGIGKSRLVWELFKLVDARSELIIWRQGRCLPYGDGVTYWALGEMLKSQAGMLDSDGAELAQQKLRAMVDGVVADANEREWVLRHVRVLLGVEAAAAAGGADERAEAVAAWRRLIESLAAVGPMVLVFEDLHWADNALLDFVDHLAEWVTDVPLLIVCTARPELLERRRDWGGGKTNAATVALEPLTDGDTARLLVALMHQAVIPAETQAALLERAQGNPLYAEEYVRMLEDGGMVDRAGDAPLPESVQGIIAARLDTLPVEEKQLLQNAAVIGKVAWLGAILELGGGERYPAEERLHRLVRKEFLRRAQRSSIEGDTEYVFRHALVRDVAYQQIARAARAEKHERAAGWIEQLAADRDETVEMRAHHYRQALDYARAAGTATDQLVARTREALGEAAERATALGSLDSAVSLFEAALELTPAGEPGRPMLLYGYCDALELIGRTDPAVLSAAIDELTQAGEAAAAATLETVLGWEKTDAGHSDEAGQAFARAEALVASAPPSREKARALAGLATAMAIRGGRARAVVLGHEAVELAETFGDAYAAARARNGMALALPYDDPEAVRLLEQAVAIATEANSPVLSLLLVNLSGYLEHAGRLADARAVGPEMADAARRFGNARRVFELAQMECNWALSAGGWAAAEQRASELMENAPTPWDRASVQSIRIQLRMALGKLEPALADAEELDRFVGSTGEPQLVAMNHAHDAICHASLGHLDLAAQAVDRWYAIDQQGATETDVWVATAAWLAGRGDRFGELAPPSFSSPWYEAASAIAGGRLGVAAGILQDIGSLSNEALTRLVWAEHLADQGRHGEAAPHLERALEIYQGEGATNRINQAEAISTRAAS